MQSPTETRESFNLSHGGNRTGKTQLTRLLKAQGRSLYLRENGE